MADLGLGWNGRAPLLLRPRIEAENSPPRLAHLLISDYVKNFYISQDLFDRYFKLATVRCPYARTVSFFSYLNLGKKFDLDHFVCEVLPNFLKPSAHEYWFFRPQSDFIVNESGEVSVDQVIFLEDLSAVWSHVAKKIGVSNPEVPHLNRSAPASRQSLVLSNAARHVIRELYDCDFKRFPHYDSTILSREVSP